MAASKLASLDDVLTCPVCFTLPEGVVYQCVNGHTICESCLSNLSTVNGRNNPATKRCPTCRVFYGKSMIRNRTAEDVLNIISNSCPFPGCSTRVGPDQVEGHKNVCTFRPFEICRTLWNENCSFQSTKPEEIIDHVKTCHPNRLTFLLLDSSNKLAYSLDKLLSWSKTKKEKYVKDVAIVDGGSWIILRQVITPVTLDHVGDVSWVVLALSNAPKDACRFIINVQTNNLDRDSCKWQWTGKPFFYKDAGRRLSEPALCVQFSFLKEYIPSEHTDVNLTVEVVIAKQSNAVSSRRESSDAIINGLGIASSSRSGAAAIREDLRQRFESFRGNRVVYINH